MNIIEKRLEEITPYHRNPRDNDNAVPYVKNSIEEFGFKVPIVIDANGIIVTGHTRYKAAQELGMDSVPCIVADDLSEDQIKAFRIADNKVAEFSKWDLAELEIELSEIDIDMSEFGIDGISDIDIDEFFEDFESEGGDEPKQEEPKEIQCPYCGMWFTVD